MSRIHDEFQVAIHLRQLSLQLEMQFSHSFSRFFFSLHDFRDILLEEKKIRFSQ
jgi:hypothetical protein